MEALTLGQAGDGTGRFVARANALNRFEMLADQLHVGVGPKRQQPRRVQMYSRGQITPFETEHNDGGIDELVPLDAWHYAENRIIK